LFLAGPAGHAPLQADWALGTGQATGAGGQCTNAIEEGIGAVGPARIYTGTGSGSLKRAEGGDGAAYVMAGWAGRMASTCIVRS